MGQVVLDEAKQIVVDYYNDNRDDGDDYIVTLDDVFIVWFSKTLQNWKALVGSHRDSKYFELTHDGDRQRTYVDIYEKELNYTVKDDEPVDYDSIDD